MQEKNRYAKMTGMMILASILTFWEAGPVSGVEKTDVGEIGRQVILLSSDRPKQREEAAQRIAGMLKNAEKEDRKRLREMVTNLHRRAGETEDFEVKHRIRAMLEEYAAGTVMWERKIAPSAQGMAVFHVEDSQLWMMGAVDRKEGKWRFLRYDLESEKIVWEKVLSELPGTSVPEVMVVQASVKNEADRMSLYVHAFTLESKEPWFREYVIDTGEWIEFAEPELPGRLQTYLQQGDSRSALGNWGLVNTVEGSRKIWASYIGFQNAILWCNDIRTGKLLWEAELGESRRAGALMSGIVSDSGRVLVLGPGRGELQAFDVKSGRLLWKAESKSAGLIQPSGRPTLFRIQKEGVWIGGSIAVQDPNAPGGIGDLKDRAWVGCFDLETGELKREQTFDTGVGRKSVTGFFLEDEKVFFSKPGWIGCYDMKTGKSIWECSREGFPCNRIFRVTEEGIFGVRHVAKEMWLFRLRAQHAWE